MTILWNTSPKYHQHMLAYSCELMCFLPPLLVFQALLPKTPADDLHTCSSKPLTKPTKAKAAVKNFQAICWQLPWAIRQAKADTNYHPPLAQSNYLQDSPQQACQMDSVSIYNLIWLTSTRISNDLGPTPSLKSLPPNDQSKCLAAVSASRQLSTSNDCCRAEESWSCLVRTANSGWQSFIVPVQ